MEQYFNTIFEDIRHERSLFLLLSLVEPDILKQSKFTDYEIEIIKNIALEKKISTKESQRNSRFRFFRKTDRR